LLLQVVAVVVEAIILKVVAVVALVVCVQQ
jgi:hypothetical protein